MFRSDEIEEKVNRIIELLVIKYFGNDVEMNVLQEVITELADSFDVEFDNRYFK